MRITTKKCFFSRNINKKNLVSVLSGHFQHTTHFGNTDNQYNFVHYKRGVNFFYRYISTGLLYYFALTNFLNVIFSYND